LKRLVRVWDGTDTLAINTDGSVNVGTAQDSIIGATEALGALDADAVVSMRGMAAGACSIAAGTLTGTVVVEGSHDGGVTYPLAMQFFDSVQLAKVTSAALTNPNAARRLYPSQGGAITHLRVRVAAYTSGTADAFCTSSTNTDGFGLALTAAIPTLPVGAYASLNGLYAEADGAALNSTGVAEGDTTWQKGDLEGRLLVNANHPNRFNCAMTSTATTSTVVTGCGAPGAGLSRYITDIEYASSIIATTTNFMTLQYGTGANCGTGTTVVWRMYNNAAFVPVIVGGFTHPIKLAANTDLCFLHPGAGTRLINIRGYVAP
jgi:hypothetical protein